MGWWGGGGGGGGGWLANPPLRPTSPSRIVGRGFVEHADIVADGLVRHLGEGAPDLPGLGLVGLILDLGLQDDVLGHVALARAAGDLGAAFGVVVAREALHARDAHDGLLDQLHGLAAGDRQVGDAEVGEARVREPVAVAHELPLGAQAGGAGVDGAGQGLEQLRGADAAQRLLVARGHGLRHLHVQRLGRRDAVAPPRPEQRPPERPVHRLDVHAQHRQQRERAVLGEEPRHAPELDRRAREPPYGRGHDGVCPTGRGEKVSRLVLCSATAGEGRPGGEGGGDRRSAWFADRTEERSLTRKQERGPGFALQGLVLQRRTPGRVPVPWLKGAAGRGGADGTAVRDAEIRRCYRGRPHGLPQREQPRPCGAREVGHGVAGDRERRGRGNDGVFELVLGWRLMPPSLRCELSG